MPLPVETTVASAAEFYARPTSPDLLSLPRSSHFGATPEFFRFFSTADRPFVRDIGRRIKLRDLRQLAGERLPA